MNIEDLQLYTTLAGDQYIKHTDGNNTTFIPVDESNSTYARLLEQYPNLIEILSE